MNRCKKCDTPILSGKYCSLCESQKNLKKREIITKVGVVVVGGGTLIFFRNLIEGLIGNKKKEKK